MASDQVKEYIKIIQQEMQSLIDYQTYESIPNQNVEPDYYISKRKWIYKIKQRVNN